ncbi:MAG: pyridoxal-phosphate dependent enzyme, partial [Halobacteriales archaeon]
YVPEAAGAATVASIERAGAEVVAVPGDRRAVTEACLADGEGWYASHAWRPEFYAGTATAAFELAAAGADPEAVVLPVGHGTLLLGLYRGYRALERAGQIGAIPRLVAGQPADGGSLLDASDGGDLAPGVRVPAPAREAQVREAIVATGGEVVAVAPAAIERAHRDLHRLGLEACSTSAVALAARREVDVDDATVVLTGRDRAP